MGIYEIIAKRREEILCIARKHSVRRIYIFGSVCRGEATAESDIDFLIEVEDQTPPWFPGGLVSELESLLGRRVDIVERESINPKLQEQILKEAMPL